jgi:hypothetical protein
MKTLCTKSSKQGVRVHVRLVHTHDEDGGDGARQGGLYLERRQHVCLSQETENRTFGRLFFRRARKKVDEKCLFSSIMHHTCNVTTYEWFVIS